MVNAMRECSHKLREYKATPESPYHFTDAGLANVYLSGIRYSVCDVCGGAVKVEIPAVKDLLDAIARAVVTKKSPLRGEEVRYLRKRLSMRATDFAATLDVSPEQLSRWENGHNAIGGSTDRLIRLAYGFIKKDAKLTKLLAIVQQEFQKWSTSIHGAGAEERIMAEYKANRHWVAEAEPVAA